MGAPRRRFGDRRRRLRRPHVFALAEVELELDIESNFARQCERTRQYPSSSAAIPSRERSTARRSQPLAGSARELRIRFVELLLTARGPLEVVTDDLVLLDQMPPALLQPLRAALVELGSRRLRESVVRCVPDQQVAETKRIVVWEHRPHRADQLLANERGEERRDPALV